MQFNVGDVVSLSAVGLVVCPEANQEYEIIQHVKPTLYYLAINGTHVLLYENELLLVRRNPNALSNKVRYLYERQPYFLRHRGQQPST